MNRYKSTVFRPISACVALALLFVFLSTENFAQSQTLSLNFSNYVAASNISDDTGLKRPRIVGVETVKTVAEPTTAASSSAMLALQMERQAFDVLNLKRAENNLPPLVWSEDMARVARSHSQEMAQFKFFSHAGRNGSMVDDRADVLGFKKWKAIGENIAYNRGYEKPAEFACERWMQSVSHRENILNPRWQEAGIGVSITADGTYYFTEVFIAR
jgi:uncharacterized protein YkwD